MILISDITIVTSDDVTHIRGRHKIYGHIIRYGTMQYTTVQHSTAQSIYWLFHLGNSCLHGQEWTAEMCNYTFSWKTIHHTSQKYWNQEKESKNEQIINCSNPTLICNNNEKKKQHQLYHQKYLFNKMSWIGRSISFPYIYLRVYLHLGGALVIHSRGCGDVSIALYCAIASINWCAHYLCALVSMLFAQHLLLSIRLFWLGTVRSAWKSYVCV